MRPDRGRGHRLLEAASPVPAILLADSCPARVRRLLSTLGQQPTCWAYLGEDVREDRALKQIIGDGPKQLAAAQSLAEEARKRRDAYLRYIAEAGKRYASRDWWLSWLAEKNIYLSKVFLQICLLRVGLGFAEAAHGRGVTLLLCVPSQGLRDCLATALRDRGFAVDVLAARRTRAGSAARALAGMAARHALWLGRWMLRLARYRVFMGAASRNPAPGADTLLVTWAGPFSFDANGAYRDAYFGNLADRLRASGRRVLTLLVSDGSLDFRLVLAGARACRELVCLPEVLFRLRDLLALAWESARSPREVWRLPPFEGLDVTSLIAEECQREWMSANRAESLVLARAWTRLSTLGLRVERIIYPFENLSYERALCQTVRALAPGTTLVGYQHARLPGMLLNYFLGPGEEHLCPLPDWIVTSGEYPTELLARSGYARARLACAGALRQEHVVRWLEKESSTRPRLPSPPTILVTPSMSREESGELVMTAVEAFAEEPEIRVILKCHAYLPFGRIRRHLGLKDLPLWVEVSEKPIVDLLAEADLLVAMSSTTCLEAVAAGVPVIHLVSSHGLDLDPLDFTPELRAAVTCAVTMREVARELLRESEANRTLRQHRGRASLRTFFSTPGPGLIHAFLRVNWGDRDGEEDGGCPGPPVAYPVPVGSQTK